MYSDSQGFYEISDVVRIETLGNGSYSQLQLFDRLEYL